MVTSGTDRRTTLITGGIVADGTGTGAAAREADVVVVDGVIRGVLAPGSASTPAGADRIDCGGALLAPGFIDVHSHADNAPLLPDDDLSKIRQGVTTEVTGNCGKSLAPVPPRTPTPSAPISGSSSASRTPAGTAPPSATPPSTPAAMW